jgi:hypothetical protein
LNKIPAGAKLYAPAVIAAYCILGNIWLGRMLYGRNIAHRGQHAIGEAISALGALLLVLRFIAQIYIPRQSARLIPIVLLSILIGIGIYHLENGPYRRGQGKIAAAVDICTSMPDE